MHTKDLCIVVWCSYTLCMLLLKIFDDFCVAVNLQGNMEAVRILYRQIDDLGLKSNFLTFAILLQCHGRQEMLAADAVKQVLNDVTKAVSLCFISCGFSIICKRFYDVCDS